MTFEEILIIIETMLSVQQELQNPQLRFSESLVELRQSVADLKEVSQRHERRIE